jgi:hypothetical protein
LRGNRAQLSFENGLQNILDSFDNAHLLLIADEWEACISFELIPKILINHIIFNENVIARHFGL